MKTSRNLKLVIITALLCSACTISLASDTGIGEAKEASVKNSSWLDRTDIGIVFKGNSDTYSTSESNSPTTFYTSSKEHNSRKSQIYIETLQPITRYGEKSKDVVFVQGRLASHGGTAYSASRYSNYAHESPTIFLQNDHISRKSLGTVGSIGIGYRHLSTGEHSYVGINGFYDRAFSDKHSRISGGFEYVVGEHEFYSNIYRSKSGENNTIFTKSVDEPFLDGRPDTEVSVGKKTRAQVMNGYDIGYALSFKNARWIKPHIEYYHWSFRHNQTPNFRYSALRYNYNSIHGIRAGATLQMTPHLSVDIGFDKTAHYSNEPYIQVMYTLGKKEFAYWGGKHSDDKITNARSKMLDKVQRQDLVVEEGIGEEHSHIAHNQL